MADRIAQLKMQNIKPEEFNAKIAQLRKSGHVIHIDTTNNVKKENISSIQYDSENNVNQVPESLMNFLNNKKKE